MILRIEKTGKSPPTGECLFVERPTVGEDLVQLIAVRVALEERVPREDFAKNTANTPDIHCRSVAGSAEKQFWRSIPSSHDHVGVLDGEMERHLPVCGPRTGKSKIGDHAVTVFVHEDVGRFDIAMHEVILSRYQCTISTYQATLTAWM